MKKDIHPEGYRPVIFEDLASGAKFLIGSTAHSKETAKWEDGKEYPKVNVEISSKSHPIYTGEERALDAGGQVEKFKKRLSAKKK
jgi:large subunit ribosomal protein L31